MKKLVLMFYMLLGCSATHCLANSTETIIDNQYDEVAQVLAGKKLPNELPDHQIYTDYTKTINAQWDKLDNKVLSHIPDFTNAHILPKTKNVTALFYPFGGPDITHAFYFFPQADTVVLTGLEPSGRFDKVKQSINNAQTFAALKKAIYSFLRRGFFITSEMGTQLLNNKLTGCIYVILLQLSKLGYTITSVENIAINSDGVEVKAEDGHLNGLKIQCHKDGQRKTVYYMRLNFANKSKRNNLMKFMENFKFATFIKSASYALYDNNYSAIRNFILKNSQAVLQDDTGIPFRFYGPKWSKYPFGRYTGPTLAEFSSYKQPNLINFYSKSQYTEIPFALGYGFNQKRTNLMLFVPLLNGILQQMQEIQNNISSCNCNKKKENLIKRKADLTKKLEGKIKQDIILEHVKQVDNLEFTVTRRSRGPAILHVEIKSN